MIDFETILEAYLDCRKRKRSTVGATEFELNYVHNLVELMNEVTHVNIESENLSALSSAILATERCSLENLGIELFIITSH